MPATTTRRRRAATRRDELVDAAMRRFAANGVRATSVDDITAEAGVAKGTFYLYFPSRDDIVVAVAERLVERIGAQMAATIGDERLAPADRIRGIAGAMATVAADSYEAELVEMLHRPENAPIHDRLGEGIVVRLVPAVRDVIAAGIADGSFMDQDPDRAAVFVLSTTSALDLLVHDAATFGPAAHHLDEFVLRGLGYRESTR